VHVCTVSELIRSIVERRGLSEREATAIVATVLREDPQQLTRGHRVPTEARIRIERLCAQPR
jgi:nucleoid DNA-binding protein